MSKVIHLDFETRSEVDIKSCGAGRYASDASTRILCTCWAVGNGPVMGLFDETVPEIFKKAVEEKWKFSAFNAMFEILIWKYRWPDLPVPEFICTRALAASHGLPQSLDRACKALHIGFAKDIEGRRLINKYSVPTKKGEFHELQGEDKTSFLQYCARDVLLSRRIFQRLPHLTREEQEVYNWTVRTNCRGIQLDIGLAEKAGQISSEILKRGNSRLAEYTNQKIFAITQVQRIKKYIKEEFGIETESLDKEAINDLLMTDNLPDAVRKILELRLDLGQTSVQKFKRAGESICYDGRIRDFLVYHGASTGRWTSQVVQLQNLPRYTVKDPETALDLINLNDADLFNACYKSPMTVLSGCIRGLILPDADEILAISDYNAIEARVLMWAAGQEDAVDMFHRGQDIYVEMARTIYRNKSLTKENKKERFLGKTTTLGCGYQMSHLKFQATCEGYGIDLGAKDEYVDKEDKDGKIYRIYYSPLAKTAVEAYRTRFSKVPQFWYDTQDAAKCCIRTGKKYKVSKFMFHREREYLYMTLPSGRRLAYHGAGCDNEGLYYYAEDSITHQYTKKRTYGGKLVENGIQATARDILAYGILQLEKQGYPVLLTVHDENVVSVKKEEHLDEIIRIMCELPEWAQGCPISAEGFVTNRYKKG